MDGSDESGGGGGVVTVFTTAIEVEREVMISLCLSVCLSVGMLATSWRYYTTQPHETLSTCPPTLKLDTIDI